MLNTMCDVYLVYNEKDIGDILCDIFAMSLSRSCWAAYNGLELDQLCLNRIPSIPNIAFMCPILSLFVAHLDHCGTNTFCTSSCV